MLKRMRVQPSSELNGLSSNEPLPIASSLTVNGKNPTPGVIVIDEHNRIYEPGGEVCTRMIHTYI